MQQEGLYIGFCWGLDYFYRGLRTKTLQVPANRGKGSPN